RDLRTEGRCRRVRSGKTCAGDDGQGRELEAAVRTKSRHRQDLCRGSLSPLEFLLPALPLVGPANRSVPGRAVEHLGGIVSEVADCFSVSTVFIRFPRRYPPELISRKRCIYWI